MSARSISHLQFNVSPENFPFYAALLENLGFDVFPDTEGYVAGSGEGFSLWFVGSDVVEMQDYDHRGVNHLSFSADSVESVDEIAAYLGSIEVESLFETPRRRDDFIGGGDTDYYQVMFSSPDNLLFEVVYTGPLATEA